MQQTLKNELPEKWTGRSRIYYWLSTTLHLNVSLTFSKHSQSSFASSSEIATRTFIIIPREFSLNAYRYILSTPTIFTSIGVSFSWPSSERFFQWSWPLLWPMLFRENICMDAASSTLLSYLPCCLAVGWSQVLFWYKASAWSILSGHWSYRAPSVHIIWSLWETFSKGFLIV